MCMKSAILQAGVRIGRPDLEQQAVLQPSSAQSPIAYVMIEDILPGKANKHNVQLHSFAKNVHKELKRAMQPVCMMYNVLC